MVARPQSFLQNDPHIYGVFNTIIYRVKVTGLRGLACVRRRVYQMKSAIPWLDKALSL